MNEKKNNQAKAVKYMATTIAEQNKTMAEIKISDLSVGDWVQIGECGHHKGSIAKVWWLSRDSNHIGLFDTCVFSECEDDVLPIPLTPEILEKNGFEENCERWYNSEARMEFEQYKDGWCRTINCGEYSVYFIKYVHQLQRAMKLEGTEKEIIL
jgi:hypothetical protein